MRKNNRKIWVTILLAAAVMFGSLSFAAEFKPFIRLVASTEIQEVETGNDAVYKIKLKNIGNYGAQPLTIRIGGDHPFRADSSELVKDVRYVGVRTEHTVEFKVTPSPLAMDKIYEFDVVFTYKDDTEAIQTNTEKAYVKIINKNIEPTLVVGVVSSNVYPAPVGVVNAMKITVENLGTLKAHKVKATLSGLSTEGIILYNDGDTKMIGEIAPAGRENVTYVFRPNEKLSTGDQTLSLNLSYNDEYGKTYEKSVPVFVSVVNQKEDEEKARQKEKELEKERQAKERENFVNKILISDLQIPEVVFPEKEFEITYTVTNQSSLALEKMLLSYEHPDSLIAKKNSRAYLDLLPGETKSVTMTMIPRKGTPEEMLHTYLTATVTFRTAEGAKEEKEAAKEYVGVYVKGIDEDKLSTANRPKLIVAKYEYGGSAMAGKEFDLELHIKNTSETQHTKNIKVVLTSDGTFTPVNTSSSIFIDAIGPGETKIAKIRYKTKLDAGVQIYSVGVKMDYEDGKGNAFDAKNNPFSETENLSLQVVQDAVLSIGDPFINPEIYVGDRYDIDVPFYNEGKAKISNLKVRIDGVAVRENSYYVGNFDPGQNDVFSVSLTAEEEGDVSAVFVFEFENPMGKVETIEKELNYYIMPASDRPSPSDDGMPISPEMQEPDSNPTDWTLILSIVGGAVLAVAIAVIVLVKRRKRMNHMKELQEMFDE